MPNFPTRRSLLGAAAAVAVPATTTSAAESLASATLIAQGGMVQGKARPSPWRIGFSNGFSGNAWRAMCVAALKQAAVVSKAQIADLFIVDGEGDANKQVHDIAGLVNKGVDAILCIPNAGPDIAGALAAATKAGIVTVPFNLPVEGDAWTTYIGTDPAQKGKALGGWLVQALGGKGKIIGLGGVPGNSYTAACWAGAKTAFHGTGIEVLAMADAFWQERRASAVMADMIAAHPTIDGVWCDGGQDATGACRALLSAGRALVPVTGDDYNGLLKLYAAQHARQPRFDFAAISEPTWKSVLALRAAFTLLSGGSVAKRQTLQPGIISGANYQNYIRPTLPDAVFVDTSLDDAALGRIFA